MTVGEVQEIGRRVGRAGDRLLEVKGLRTSFHTSDGIVRAVTGVDFHVDRGEVMGLVGESGCGKSVTSLSIMRLIVPPGRIEDGEVLFDGEDLLRYPEKRMRELRGERISMIFQQPTSSLNPVYDVGFQLGEVLELHRGLGRRGARARALELLQMVGIPDPRRRLDAFPHELSGGMAQRVMIAMALACEPELLIADEPTTALDVTIQAQILDLMRALQQETNTAMILITHDLGVVAEMCDRVAVMYAGEIVEQTDVATLFESPKHPYTQGLISSVPLLGQERESLATIPGSVPNLIDLPTGCRFAPRCTARIEFHNDLANELHPELLPVGEAHAARCWLYHDADGTLRERPLNAPRAERMTAVQRNGNLVEVEHLALYFPIVGGVLHRKVGDVKAVDDVSFTIRRGETLGLVGESGCGKTTVGRTLLRLVEPTAGKITFDGTDITRTKGNDLKPIRRRMQVIFQDPYASLDPRAPIGASIGEGLRIHGVGSAEERRNRVAKIMEMVGLQAYHARRYPHEFSGGQRQRIGIARALVLEPDLIVCDEPVSALDVSIQAQVLNLLRGLQRELGLTYLFIAHNMGVVEHISDRVAVMYLGGIAELAESREIYRLPLHPYTVALLSAVPAASPRGRDRRRRIILLGDVPSPVNPPSGCRFHTRCWLRKQLDNPERCVTERPELRQLGEEHGVACHFAEELLPGEGRERHIAEAARTSSAFDVSDEEAAGPIAPPPVDTGGVFDRGMGDVGEETHGRL